MNAPPSEPITVTVVRFECPSCGRRRSSKAKAREHMGRCWRNPANKGCKTCANFRPNDCCGMPDVYGCYTPMCPKGDSCAVGIDMSAETTGPGPLAIQCPKWAPKGADS